MCDCDGLYVLGLGDTAPTLDRVLRDEHGAVVDLTGATGLQMVARHVETGVRVVKTPAVVSPATDGRLRVTMAAGDLQLAGSYEVQWLVTLASGAVRSWPQGGYDRLDVVARL